MNKQMLENFRKLFEAVKASIEYERSYSSIDRDVFDTIALMDPKTSEINGEVAILGFGAKQLLLRCYLNGETDFIDKADEVRDALNAYYPNIKTYPKFPQFASVADFLTFMENPEANGSTVKEIQKEDKITDIYNANFSSIDRADFDEAIVIDPDTDLEKGKIGVVARQVILPDLLRGVSIKNVNKERLRLACQNFASDSNSYPAEKRQLSSYKSINDFITYVLEGAESELVTSIRNNENTEARMVNIIGSTREYDILEPLTHAANNAISGGKDNMNWCTGWERNDSYWNNYTRNGSRLFCFMNKARNRGTENRDVNWQIQVNNNYVVSEFLNGWDKQAFTGETSEARFKNFLISKPDVLLAIKDKDPFDKMPVVANAISLLSLSDKPLTLNDSTLNDIEANITDYSKLTKELIVDIKKIPPTLFANFTALTTITFTDKVEEIGAQAFKNCVTISTLNFPESLRVIDKEAFSGCVNLRGSIRLPNNLTDVKTRAFAETHCKLKIDIARTSKIRFDRSDTAWVKSHVQAIKL